MKRQAGSSRDTGIDRGMSVENRPDGEGELGFLRDQRKEISPSFTGSQRLVPRPIRMAGTDCVQPEMNQTPWPIN